MSRKYFAYINEDGYLALKCYSTKQRYDELKESDMPIFIPVFKASDSCAAKLYIKKLLERSLFCSWNNWDEEKNGA